MYELIDSLMQVLGYMLLSLVGLFVAFVITAKLVRQFEDTVLDPVVRYVVVPAFMVCDWLLNFTTAWWMFLDMPNSWGELVTARLKRYKREYLYKDNTTFLEDWRLGFAMRMCKLLSKHDPEHC
jgi:hypothetical protein